MRQVVNITSVCIKLLCLLLLSTVSAADEQDPHPIIHPDLVPPFDGVVDLTVQGIQKVLPNAKRGGSLPEGLSAVRVNTRELEGSSLAVMQQKGRTLPVAAARFLSQIMEQLAQEEVGVTLA